MRIYIDTSVIGGCLDKEFSLVSNVFVSRVRDGVINAVISDLTLRELRLAPESVMDVFDSIPSSCIESVLQTEEIEILRNIIFLKVSFQQPAYLMLCISP